jgi:hypothetical protein
MTYGDLGVPAGDGSGEPECDLATMLAAMDDRLRLLQQELESVAAPIAGRMQRRPESAVAEVEARSDRSPRNPAGASAPRTAPAGEQAGPVEAPALPRKRAKRAVTAVARGRSAPAGDGAPGQRTEPVSSQAAVRRAILEAEREAQEVVEEARRRIAEIGGGTRALLERPPTASPPPSCAPAQPSCASQPFSAPPAPTSAPVPSRSRRWRPATPDAPERREYEGAVTVEAGPFGDVSRLSEFEHALAAIPAIEDVYIRTFERRHAHFDLQVVEPTRLIAELQARVPGPLHVIEASERDVRLEIVEDDAEPGAGR